MSHQVLNVFERHLRSAKPCPENVSQIVKSEIHNLGFGDTILEPFTTRLELASFGVGLSRPRLAHDWPRSIAPSPQFVERRESGVVDGNLVLLATLRPDKRHDAEGVTEAFLVKVHILPLQWFH